MILVDANLLLYAYHPQAEQHEKSRAWLEAALSGPDLVHFPWLTLWAFPRIVTNPRVFERPLSTSEAEAAISSWLARPAAGIRTRRAPLGHPARPGTRRPNDWPAGMDAVLAAIALEHGATIYTTDCDFTRFPGLKWMNPLVANG